MTKSIRSAVFGVLEKQRKFDIDAPAPIPEWANDKRKSTTSDLLHMNSGLQWVEDYFLMLQNAFSGRHDSSIRI
jgi:CubicO group peptidase (beta-lactamase class C family)